MPTEINTDYRLLLPEDLEITVISDLAINTQALIKADPKDFVLTRPKNRRRSVVIDAEMVDLLRAFRQPTTIPEAVLLYSLKTQRIATEVLTEAYPILLSLRQARYLVPYDAPDAGAHLPLLSPATMIGTWVIIRCLQSFEDSDVYLAAKLGTQAAIKLIRPPASAWALRRLKRESSVLRLIEKKGFSNVPKVIEDHLDNEPPWLAISWVNGISADLAAATLRKSKNCHVDLLGMTAQIADTYSKLHKRGIIHGDIHPRNILINNDEVNIIDFGLASIEDSDGSIVTYERGGVGWAYEPEFANAVINKTIEPRVTYEAEQYSIAAVIHYLLTGKHHHIFPLERLEMFKSILENEPLSLEKCGQDRWSLTSEALLKALNKDPKKRFKSLSRLTVALKRQVKLIHSLPQAAITKSPNRGFFNPVISRNAKGLLNQLRRPPALASFQYWPKPLSSINHGAAGTAYVTYRLSRLLDDVQLLAASECWSALANASIQAPGAFVDSSVGISDQLAGTLSLYHSTTGVYMVQALIGHANGNVTQAKEAIKNFINQANMAYKTDSEPRAELVFGKAGVLIGACIMLESLKTETMSQQRDALQSLLSSSFSRSVFDLSVFEASGFQPKFADGRKNNDMWGLAHGKAGQVLAAARTAKAVQSLYGICKLFVETWLSHVHDKWSNILDSNNCLSGSWCNGASGMLLTLISVQSTFGLDLEKKIQQLANNVAHAKLHNFNLCCGATGYAYALLEMYQHSKEKEWLHHATRLSSYAAGACNFASYRSHSLFKGEIGTLLLMEDIQQPDLAVFPCLMSEQS